MINAITAQSHLSAPKARSAAAGQGFSTMLPTPESSAAPGQPAPPPGAIQPPCLNLIGAGFFDSSAAVESAEHFQSVREARGDIMRSIFKLIEETTGQSLSESVGLHRKGDHFRVYSVRQLPDGAEDGPAFPHPQGDLLESVLNGTNPELAELSKEVKALLEKADALLPSLNAARDALAVACGQEPEEPLTADDEKFVIGLPTRFADAGRRMAEGASGDFKNFRSNLTPDDLGRLSENQIYSRYFVSRASKEQIAAALDSEKRAKAAKA